MYPMTEMMNADTCEAVDRIRDKYLDMLPYNQKVLCWQFARKRKEHILSLEAMKKESWKTQLS